MRGRSGWLEWTLYGFAVVVFSAFFLAVDAFDWMYQVTRSHEAWELDEWILVGLAVLLVTAVAAVVRSVRLKREMARRRLAEQQLEEIFRTKQEFLGVLGHEMRTPLNGIVSMLDLARAETDPAEAAALVDIGLKSATTMNRLLDDLLSYARLEQTNISTDLAMFDIRRFIDEAAASMSWLAAEKGVKLEVVAMADIPRSVVGHPVPLRQILVNLISNGVKFTDRGVVRVQASMAENGSGKFLLRLSVSDTGPGIAPEHQDKIFDAFYQAENHATRRGTGVGLGLNIVSRLVQIMDGEVHVSSTPGRGATFDVLIPVQIP